VQQARRFVDSFGFHWDVVEIDGEQGPGNVAGDLMARPGTQGWLYFMSRGWTRVIRNYPADWRNLDWVELEDLCADALALSDDALVHPLWAPRGDALSLRVRRESVER
jgi:hypothetical protein